MMRKLFALALILGALVVVGCGGTSKVEGVVTLDGKTVPGATVVFVPDGAGESADGFTDASGTFTLSTKGKPGVKNGNYKVLVTKAEGSTKEPMKPEDAMKAMSKKGAPATGGLGTAGGSKNELPLKYSSADKTPLKVTIPPAEKPIKIELSAK